MADKERVNPVKRTKGENPVGKHRGRRQDAVKRTKNPPKPFK